MPPFDVLNLETPLFGAKLLEASAGTGKTFAIEHIFVRLLLEAPLEEEPLAIDQILAITFTRAAAREMRIRIRANLQKTLIMLNADVTWPYLRPHVRSEIAKRRIEDALLGFDRAQIFTIHGFCQRSLSQFSLEANTVIQSSRELSFRQTILPRLLDFLEKQTSLCPEQIGRLFSKKRDMATLSDAILDAPNPESGGSFAQDLALIRGVAKNCPYSTESLFSDFERLKPNFKVADFKGVDFDEQLNALLKILENGDERALRLLIEWKGSIFEFLHISNRKVRIKEEFSSPLISWCIEHFGPIVQEASDFKKLFRRLRFEWQQHFEHHLEEKSLFSPDFLLEKMKRALDHPQFLDRMKQKYRAAIVDEFQDTDAVQWEIFRRLFFENKRLFYLVGDPKQSIYRFRKADLYTYFDARRSLGEKSYFSLDTNYRSVPGLISALNELFSDEHVHPWLLLPKENREESYHSIKAGSSLEWDPKDGKKPLEFFVVPDLAQSTLSFVYQEMLHLKEHVKNWGSFALLVKDRVQAQEAETYLKAHGLPCFAKSQMPLGRSLAFLALEELFQVIYFPRDASSLKIFITGPFVLLPIEQASEGSIFLAEIFDWKTILLQDGLPAFFRAFLETRINGCTVYERIKQRSSAFFLDVFQIMEQLLAIQTPSYEAIKRFFRELQAADLDEDVNARRRVEIDEEAIQIMTMHASKGLEFDIVFALGVAAKTISEDDELLESEAEKIRQLYVALTRARLRQYIPLIESSHVSKRGDSPLDLFWKRSKMGNNALEIVEKLKAQNPHIGLERSENLQLVFAMPPPSNELVSPPLPVLPRAIGKIFSYTLLRQKLDSSLSIKADDGLSREDDPIIERNAEQIEIQDCSQKTLHTLPRGTETGILMHRIFERLLTENGDMHQIVNEEMRGSILQDWTLPIIKMVEEVMAMPLIEGMSLCDCKIMRTEVEFLFKNHVHFFKGFIDLIFICKNRLYILDWKTNYLGTDDSFYTVDNLKLAMDQGDYWFQGSLYAQAVERAWLHLSLGGVYYLFLRGVHAPSRGVLFFQPTPIDWKERI